MPKYLSGRVKRSANSELKSDRYTYLSLEQAEPNPSDPQTLGIADGSSSTDFPVGTKYQVFSVYGDPNPGTRYWQPVGGGIIPGSISVFDEGTVIGGANSITSLNFEGVAIAATSTPPGTGVAATITVAPPGHSGQLLFNLKVGSGITDFSSSNNLVFDPNVGIFTSKTHSHVGLGGSIFSAFSGTSGGVGVASVGIGTTNPTARLHVKGGLRLEGTIYDGDNEPGTAGDLIVKANDGTLEWKEPKTVQSGAGGYISNVQYHDDTGLVEGASNFVWVEPKVVGAAGSVGIGSTQPIVLFEVLGNSILTGVTTFTGGDVDFIGDAVGITSVFWDKSANELKFYDGSKASFGDSGDLQIYHSGTHSFIEDTGTGNLVLKGSRIDIQDTDGNELLIAEGGQYVRLAYGANERFTTTGVGASAVGIMSASQSFISPELYINPSGIGTIGNVKISGNTVNTTVGALTLDSNSGTITTPDKFTITDSTDSTSVDSGALQVDGGIGINKNIHGGGSLRILGYPAADIVTYPYDFRTSGNPPSGQVQFDQGSYTTATTLKIHKTDRTNNDHPAIYAVLRLGDTIKIINDTDTSKSILYKLTGDSTVSGDVYTFPISYLEGTWSEALQGTDVDVVIDQVGEGSVSLASAGGITTTGGDLYIGGDLFVQDDIFLDEGNFQKLIVKPGPPGTGVSTFWGDINVGVGNTAAFIDAGLSRVGIGTSVPSDELHLFNQHGDVTLKLESYENNKDTQIKLFHRNNAKWTISNDTSNTHQLEIMGDGGTNDKFFVIKQDGYIGIGEENPSYILDIKGKTGGNATLQLRNDGTQSSDHTAIRNKIDSVSASNYIYFGDNDDDDVGIIEYDHGENSLKFTVNTGEYLTIESTGIVTSKGQTLFSKQLNVLGVSTFGGITTVHDTLFSKELGVLGFSTFVGITTVNDTLFSNELGVLGFSTFVGITTVNDTLFSKELNVLGVSTFHDTVHLKGGLKDKDGDLGENGQLLESRDSKTNWVNAGDLTVQNATKVGVGTTNSVVEDVPSTVSYYPTFVNSNNNQSRENEFLYSDIGLTYSLSYTNGIGIGSVGIGTSNPQRKLVVSNEGEEGFEFFPGDSANGGSLNLYNRKTTSYIPLTINSQDFRWAPSGGTEAFRIDASGRVLIGVQASYANASIDDLQVGNNNSATQTGITLGSTDESAIAFADAGDARAGSIIYNHGSDAMIIKTAGQNERVTIDSIGNFIVSAATGISTFVGGAHVTGVGVSIAVGGLDVNPLGISTLHNLETRFINDINHYLEIGDFSNTGNPNSNTSPFTLYNAVVRTGSYKPKHGEIIKIEFSEDGKPTRQLIYEYDANTTNPGVGKMGSYNQSNNATGLDFQDTNATLTFNKTALPGSYNTTLFDADTTSGALDIYSFGQPSFRVTFSDQVDISHRVGIGTSVPSDPQGTDRGGFLAVAGIVTAYNMYADKFYGPIEGSLIPTGDLDIEEWIRHVGDTNTKFGFPTDDTFTVTTANVERLRIDSGGRLLMNNITAVDDWMLQMEGAGGTGQVPAILFKNGTTSVDETIGGWTAYNTTNQVAYVLAAEESSNADAYIKFATKADGSPIAERLRIESEGKLLYSAPSGMTSITSKRTDTNSNNGDGWFELKVTSGDNTEIGKLGFYRDTNTDDAHFTIKTRDTGGSNAERLRITSKGNVGIGTYDVKARLHIYDDPSVPYSDARFRITKHEAPTNERHWELSANLDGHLRIQGIDDSSDNAGHGAGGGDHFDFWRDGKQIKEFRAVGAGNTWFTVFNSTEAIGGRSNLQGVGIGTTAPYEAVHPDNVATVNAGIVSANYYFGTFEGTIGDDVTLDTADKANKIKAQTTSSNAAHYLTFVNSTGTGYKDVYVNTGISYVPDVWDDDTDRGTLTITGNLSIGGTVTYEDVTNVDSLGIITARTGLHVLENGIDVKSGVSTFKDGVETVSIGSTTGSRILKLGEQYCLAGPFGDVSTANLPSSTYGSITYGEPNTSPIENYIPIDGQLITITLSENDKETRTFVFEYADVPSYSNNNFQNKCALSNLPGGAPKEFNQITPSQGSWRFSHLAISGSHGTDFKTLAYDYYTNNSGDSHSSFKIRVGNAIVSMKSAVGIGTSVPMDAVSDEKALLAVSGIVTAHEMYASKFYGPIEGALTPTGDFDIEEWIRHVGDDDTKFGFPEDNAFAVETAGSERFRIVSTGYAQFAGASDVRLTLGSQGTAGQNTSNWVRGQNADLMYNAASGAHIWEIGGSEKMRINSTGDVRFAGTNLTDNTNKSVNLTAPSYDIDEEDVNLVQVENESTFNQISFGGGTSELNAATNIRFLTAPAVNTVTGTERMRIDSSGTAIVHKGIETVSIGATNGGNILRLQDSTTAASCITGDFSNSNPYTSGGSNVGISIWKPQNPVKGSYKPVAGELIRFTFTQSGKETRTFVWEYDAGFFPTTGKCALYDNSITNYNEVTSTADGIRWQFNYTAHSDGYSTNFLTDGINYYGSDLKDDGLSVEVGTVVSIMSAVGIGTSVPSDPQSSVDRGAILAVSGIVTAYNMYAEKFYGPIEGALTPTGDIDIEQWIRHIGNTNTKFGFPADNTFTVETAATEALRIDSGQRLLLGTTAYKQNLNSSADTSGQLAQFVGTTDDVNHCVGIFAYSGTSNPTTRGAKIQLNRARSTDGTTNTAVADDDLIGSIEFKGNDGTNFSSAARIDAYVDGGVGTDDMPGRLSFWTTNEGTAVPKERMRITENGAVVVAGTTTYSDGTYGEGKLQFNTKTGAHIGATSVADTNNSITHVLFKNYSGPVGSIGTHDDDLLVFTNNVEKLRITHEGHLYPGTDDTYNIGKSATELRWNNIYAKNVYAENLSSGGGTSPTDSVFTSTGSINGNDQKIDDTADTNSLLEYTIFFSLDATPTYMQSQKILIMSNGTNAYMQEYAIMFNDTRLVTLSVVNTGGANKTELRGTTLVSQVTYKLSRRTIT